MAQRILITSALPYINGVKHLGNLVGSMLPADVYARFQRSRGKEVLFICATDEHGTPAELAAAEVDQDIKQYCTEQHNIQKQIAKSFSLSFDHFGRSSSNQNAELTQHFAIQLESQGLVSELIEPQIYSPTDKRFLPDRYIEGTCPKCKFDRARGDQCDNCGSTLDPTDLIDPRSKISGSTNLETKETNHLYLLQNKMENQIRNWVDEAVSWPSLARSIAYKWLDEGLKPRAITRDLNWGIPVEHKGVVRKNFEDKVFYVWFDAPIEYIAATWEWAEATGNDWRRWWRTDEGADDVSYVQFMGKDNVAFHTVSFPVTLIGSGEPWKLVDKLKAFNWLNWYGGKFSTSENRGVFMDQALEIQPSDSWRWYLMSNAPESSDSSFSWEHYRNTINADLVNVLGNFSNRLISFTYSKFDGQIPTGGKSGIEEENLNNNIVDQISLLTQHYEAMEFRKAASTTRSIWALGNEYLSRVAPWSSIKTDKESAALAVRTALNLIPIFAKISFPIIPETSSKLLSIFEMNETSIKWPKDGNNLNLNELAQGSKLYNPGPLFDKIDEETLNNWKTSFPGGEN